MKKTKLFVTALIIALVCPLSALKAQTTIYTTDFGAVALVNPSGWTFNGIGMNISTNNASTGYAGASGGACLGEGNSGSTFTNTSGQQQTSSPIGTSEAILQISTATFSNVALSFGVRKSSASYDANATYSLGWSTNGINYTQIVYTEPASGSWGLVSGSGLTLPLAAANQPSLYLKWTFVRTGTGSNYKIDDVTVTGNVPSITPATISFVSNDTMVVENVASANVFVKLTGVSTATSAISVSISALSNASASDYTLGVSTVTFAANAPINSTAAIAVNLNNDAIIEGAEYIVLRLSNPQNGTIGAISQFVFYIGDDDKAPPLPSNSLTLNLLSSFSISISGANSAEIVAHDPTTQRLYIANSIGAKLDIVDFVNPSSPTLLYSIPITTLGNINSVAVRNGIVAAAIENGTNPQDSGKVVFFDANGIVLKQVKVGMMPDMITFNHAGTKVITANEGEPNAAYTQDPDGSVSIIDISGGIAALSQTHVSHVTFTVYNGQEATLRSQGIRIYGLGASASKDFEPEYVSVSKDDSKAWITLQENNAIVEINLANNTINYLKCLGTKNHSVLGNGFDASNVTRGVNIANFNIKGMYLPDAIASYTVGGVNYLITANEGDSRAYSGFSEEQRIAAASVTLDPVKFPNAAEMKNNYFLGRLNITDKTGDVDNDGDLDTLYSYGSRSFSIWNANTGNLVYDSKDDLEMITSTNSFSLLFNASNSNNTKKDRSDDKGPEPEGVTIGVIGANTYAFIALERIGGVMVYDVTNPNAPVYVAYVNNRSLPLGGPDNGSEGIIFIPQSQSPNGQHIVIAANEISSTLSIWGIAGCSSPLSSSLSVTGATAVCADNPPMLSVPSATGVTYQWSVNGSVISGATSHTVSATASGNYSVSISTGTNCFTSSLTKSITINDTPTLVVSGATAVCIGSSVSQTITGASTYSWSSGQTTSVVTLAPTSNTTYTATGTGTNGCSSSINSTVAVLTLPSLTISSASINLCTGLSSTVSISGASTYSWSSGQTSSLVTLSPATTTNYIATGTGTNGCSSSASTTINVLSLPTITLSPATPTVCASFATTVSASGASTYAWSSGATSSIASLNPPINTVYSVTGTGANGCASTKTVLVSVIALPSFTISGNTTACLGTPLSQTATGASTYTWVTGTTGSVVSLFPISTTTYAVIGSLNGCSSTVNRVINVHLPPTVSISGPTFVCQGSSVMQTATGALTYSWSTGVTGAAITLTPSTNTTFTLTGVDQFGCVSAPYVRTLPVYALPVLTVASTAAEICLGQTATVSATGASTYSWDNGSLNAQLVVSPTITTSYSVTGTSSQGCVAKSQLTQSVSACTSIGEKGFTSGEVNIYPNPAKDYFVVNTSERVSIMIFNSLGANVWSDEHYVSETAVQTKEFAKGVYLVQISDGNKTVLKKLIVE